MKLKTNTKHKSIANWLFEGNRAYIMSAGMLIATLVFTSVPGLIKRMETKIPPKPTASTKTVAPTASNGNYDIKVQETPKPAEVPKPTEAPVVKEEEKEIKPTESPKPTVKPTEFPKPTEAPRPTASAKPTPKPTETPKPVEIIASKYASIEEALSANKNLTVEQIYLFKNVYDAIDQNRGKNYPVLNEIVSSVLISQQSGMVLYQVTVDGYTVVNPYAMYGDTFSKNGYDNTTLEMINNIFYTGSVKDSISRELILEKLGFKEVKYFQNLEYKYLNELFGTKEVMKFYKSNSGIEYFEKEFQTLLKDNEKASKLSGLLEAAMKYGNTALINPDELFKLMREAYNAKNPDATKMTKYDAMISPYIKEVSGNSVNYDNAEFKNNTNYSSTPVSADKVIQKSTTKSDIIKVLNDNEAISKKDKEYIKVVLDNIDSNPYLDLDVLQFKMDGFTVRKFDSTNMISELSNYAGQRPHGIRAIDVNLLNTTDAEFYRYVIMHEYWHYIACTTEIGNPFLIGNNGSGRLLNEGITALLARRDANYDKDNTYVVNSEIAKIVAELVGDNTLLKAYSTPGGYSILTKALEPFTTDLASASAYVSSTDVMNDADKSDTKVYGDSFKLVLDDTIKMIEKSTEVDNGVKHNYPNMLGSLNKIILQLGLGKEYLPKLEDLAKDLKIDKIPVKNSHSYFNSSKQVSLTTNDQILGFNEMKDMIKGLVSNDISFGYASPTEGKTR